MAEKALDYLSFSLNLSSTSGHIETDIQSENKNFPGILFGLNTLKMCDSLSMLGVTVVSDLSQNEHSVAKSAARKIGFLFRFKRFFTPLHFLTLYKAQIRPCLEYGSHLWKGASRYSLATLDTIQKRAVRLIDDRFETLPKITYFLFFSNFLKHFY